MEYERGREFEQNGENKISQSRKTSDATTKPHPAAKSMNYNTVAGLKGGLDSNGYLPFVSRPRSLYRSIAIGLLADDKSPFNLQSGQRNTSALKGRREQ